MSEKKSRGRKPIYKDGAKRSSICLSIGTWKKLNDTRKEHKVSSTGRLMAALLEHCAQSLQDGKMFLVTDNEGGVIVNDMSSLAV